MKNEKLDPKLNKREKYKAQLRPIDYFEEFQSLDFENLGEGDRYFLQDFGIFNTDFLEDEFTLRLRLAAGRITSAQFTQIADVVEEYNLTIILTVRGGVQLHDIEADNVLEIWQKLNSHGLTSWQSFGDNIRNIVSDVYDGCGKYAQIQVNSIAQEMQNFILKNPRYVGMLPRRVSIGISGNSANVTSFFSNDIYFALAKKDDVYGFNVYMGGKNTEVAQSVDIFLKTDEVFDFFKAFVETFYLHGSRYTRSRTRLFYLIEDIGINALKALIQKEYKKPFLSAGKLQLKKVMFSQYEELQDGSYSYCYHTDFSRLKVDEIREIADFAKKSNCEIRVGIDQNIYLLGLREKLTPFSSPILSSTVVTCAGNLCPYAAWSIKDETSYLPLQKIAKHQLQVGFSGCAKGCGRHRHTDIGLIGLKTNNFGDTEGGARVFLGAIHTHGGTVGRMIFSMVPFVHLDKTLSTIIDIYEKSKYKDFEDYSKNVLDKFSQEFLALWYLSNFKTKQSLELVLKENPPLDSDESFEFEKAYLLNEFSDLDSLSDINEKFFNTVSSFSKELWTIEGRDPHYKPPIKRVNFR
jgi:ferredoxin-nitrite reductase